jgi:hypothetical protein
LVIPETVIAIGSVAFGNNKDTTNPIDNTTNLKKIFITANSKLKTIGNDAFAYSKIEFFDFENGSKIQYIESNAFTNCPFSATDYNMVMTLPENLVSIGSSAFNGGGMNSKTFAGSSGVKIVIPPNVTTLGANAISNMGGASNVIVEIGYENNYSLLNINNIVLTDPWYGLIHSNGGSNNADIRTLNFYTNKYSTTDTINEKEIRYIMCGPEPYINFSCTPGSTT